MLLRLFKTTHKLSLPSGCKASQFADDMVQFKSKTGSCNKHRTMTGQRQRRWEGNVSQHSACAQNHGRYAGIRLETQKRCESNCRPNSCENHGDETQETPAGAPGAVPVHSLPGASASSPLTSGDRTGLRGLQTLTWPGLPPSCVNSTKGPAP